MKTLNTVCNELRIFFQTNSSHELNESIKAVSLLFTPSFLSRYLLLTASLSSGKITIDSLKANSDQIANLERQIPDIDFLPNSQPKIEKYFGAKWRSFANQDIKKTRATIMRVNSNANALIFFNGFGYERPSRDIMKVLAVFG